LFMKIVSIEPTPSPNAMKLNMDESLEPGTKYAYTTESAGRAPAHLRALLAIEGVKGVYQAADFIAVERDASADWRVILAEVREAYGEDGATSSDVPEATDGYGEATVLVQIFRGIPMQVRVRSGHEEARVALPERLTEAAMKAGAASPNLIRERQLVDQGVRYGELTEIAALVAAELDAAYDDARLLALVAQAERMGDTPEAAPMLSAAETLTPDEVKARLDDADWKRRYAALERLKPAPEHLPIVTKALADDNFSIRRLAVVYLGDIKGPEAIKHLITMLKDPSVAVRRTAGDALSDIGDPSAQPAMIDALADKSKIVRWRAARFLYDLGDEHALGALQDATDDPEFEVALQARMAAERIASGEAAAGTVWQQMANRRESP
jgi:hypothetical protein